MFNTQLMLQQLIVQLRRKELCAAGDQQFLVASS
jgi:hypothetical protein